METKKLIRKLSKKFPKSIARKYHDFPGLQIGKLRGDTKCILLCLDFDDEVLNIMKNKNILNKVDLIITHHPFIFGTYAKVLNSDSIKKELTNKMLNYDIPIYSYHTNFDEGIDGMNDALAEKLELVDITRIENAPIGRKGTLLNPMNINDFAKYATKKLNVEYSRLINYGVKTIKTVGIVGGAGWYLYKEAMLDNCDIFISGDIPHHGRREILLSNYNFLDMPHEIEKIFINKMESNIKEIDSSIEIIKIDHEKLPILIINE